MVRDEKQLEADGVVHSEACAWIAQLESGDMSEADREELRQWIARSSSHEAAIKEYAELWSGLDSLGLLHPTYEAVRKERRDIFKSLSGVWWRKPQFVIGAMASAVMLIVTSAWIVLAPLQPKTEELVVATAIGEARAVELSDGSSINVNTASNMQVNYGRRERIVHLMHGEAVFSVATDEQRPFVVRAGQQTVKAIGTEFSVRLVGDEVKVVVTEGMVEIAQAALAANREQKLSPDPAATEGSDNPMPTAVLVQGQSASATREGVRTIEAIDLDQVAQRLSWRNGVLDFSGETLTYAVGEVERYTAYEIEIADADLANLRVGGVFRLSDAGQFIDVLEENFNIEAERTSDRRVILRTVKRQ